MNPAGHPLEAKPGRELAHRPSALGRHVSKRQSRPWHVYALAAVAAVVVAALAAAEIGPPASSARTATQIGTADKGIVQSTVSGSGNVEASTST